MVTNEQEILVDQNKSNVILIQSFYCFYILKHFAIISLPINFKDHWLVYVPVKSNKDIFINNWNMMVRDVIAE